MEPTRRRSTNVSEDKQATQDPETLQRILKVARRLFLAKGFKGVSMKEIADSVQVTPAALYYYFPEGKSELFIEMVKRLIVEWSNGAFQVIQTGHDVREQLTRLTHYMLTLPLSDFLPLVRDMTEQFQGALKKEDQWMRQIGQQFVHRLTDLFAHAQERGEVIADIPPEVMALMYEGSVTSIHRRKIMMSDNQVNIETNLLVEMLVNGLLDGIANKD